MITRINMFIFQSLMLFYSDFTFHVFLRLVAKLRRLCLNLMLSSLDILCSKYAQENFKMLIHYIIEFFLKSNI